LKGLTGPLRAETPCASVVSLPCQLYVEEALGKSR
jgi:hypothetical protein